MNIGTSTIVLVVIGLVVIWGIMAYNRFIKLVNLVKEAWSGIDVQLKRRFNLIPNLIETVKGYTKHESETLRKVTELRANSDDVNERGEQEAAITSAIAGIMVVVEDYPELMANKGFLDLQNSLEEIEGEIQMVRRYYNGTVRDLNVQVESFPSNLIANVFNFNSAEFFEIELPGQRDVPEVKF
jgi:LemA protein